MTSDKNKTFLLGVDVMSGTKDRVMLPWKVDLAGKMEIGIRKKGSPWTVVADMKVLEENKYNPVWDEKDWKPAHTATITPTPQ